jgi:hypothetical protein
MATVIQPQPTWQEALGSGLGQGIQAGVTNLLQQKLNQMAREQQASEQEKVIQSLAKGGFLGKDQQIAPDVMAGLRYAGDPLLQTILKQSMLAPQREAESRAATMQAEGKTLQEIYESNPNLSANFKVQLNKANEGFTKEKESRRQFEIKQSQPFRTKLAEQVKSDEATIAQLDRLENLVKNPKTASGIQGLFPSVLGNQETQEAQGLYNRIIMPLEQRANSDAKLRAYIDSFAKPSDTKEAQIAKIHTARELAKISGLQSKAAHEIEEKLGFSPHNIDDLSWERAKPEINKAYKSIERGPEDEWLDASQLPASEHKNQTRIAEDGTREISNGREWIPESQLIKA